VFRGAPKQSNLFRWLLFSNAAPPHINIREHATAATHGQPLRKPAGMFAEILI